MNQTKINQTIYERLLKSRGGGYIILIQSMAQLISFLAAAIGIIYTLIIAKFDPIQTQQLIISWFFFVALSNLIIPFFMAMASVNARLRLDHLVKGKQLPIGIDENELEIRAWQEVITLPGRFMIAALATAYILVVLAVVLFMVEAGGVTSAQAAYVATGGIISTTYVVIQNTLALDRNIAPARQILMPRDFSKQVAKSGMKMRTRTQIIMAVMVISAIALLVPLGYQALVDYAGGAASSNPINPYMNNATVVLFILVLFSLIISYMLSKSFTDPIEEMSRAMDKISKGSLNERAKITTSDETLLLTIRLNQMIEQLQESRASLERQVTERTSELTRRTEQLQAAAQVAREAASQQDVNQLLERTVVMITARFGFYHTGIFLLNETRDYAILRAASSDDGKRMMEKGHRLVVGQQGIVGAAAYQNRPRVAMDVGADTVYFNNPDLPRTRAEAAFPLTVRDEVIGVLDIQSTSVDAFSQSDVELLQTLADQIALAIQNARLIEESRIALRQVESSNIEAVRRAWLDRSRMQKKAYHYSPAGASPSKTSAKPTGMSNRISIPISLRGQRIGNINLSRRSDTIWSEEDRSLAIEVANQVGLALENARLLDEAQRRAAQEQTVSELAARLGRSIDPDSLLQATVRELHLLPNVEEVSVYIGSTEENSSNNRTERH